VHALEYDAFIGMTVFTTQSLGIGGRLRKHPEDFIVQEIGLDGSIAPLEAGDEEYSDQTGKITQFFLVKRNIDSIQAIRRLSRSLGVSYRRFSYAGIKDRRAVTAQRVSYRGPPHDLIGREISQLSILNPHRASKPIVPGALKGNRFTIIIREVALETQEIENLVTQTHQEIIRIGGVLNFFGPQRFGVIRPNTHLVGKQIVLKNFEQAVQILLENAQPLDLAEEDTGLFEDSVQGTYERAILHYLNKHPAKFKESLQVLPKDLIKLYVHAYQSYLFNKAISERSKQGISLQEPEIGDFTMPISGEIHGVRPVTKGNQLRARQEVKKGAQQLVVPIIGYDFEHVPLEGAMGQIYHAILESEEITPRQFRLEDLPAFSSRGTFRPLLLIPKNFHVSIIEEGENKAVQIQFDLAKGGYASVILREFMKPESPTQL
jgi:tRNA pseudouridine13 synthase